MIVAVDPGVKTGVAIINDNGKLAELYTLGHVAAINMILGLTEEPHQAKLIIEDARGRTYFGKADFRQAKYGAGVREGAGSAKREAAIWEEWARLWKEKRGVPYIMAKPLKGGTKIDENAFYAATGWAGRTSAHARDAAMLGLAYARKLKNPE